MSIRPWKVAFFSATALALVFSARPALAIRFKYPVLIQVTHNTVGDVQEPKLRSEQPQRITFTSNGNVLGTAPGHKEIWEWDLDTRTMRRVTTTAGGESYETSRPTDVTQSARPEFTAFVSTGNLDPSIGNADGNTEIFIWVRETGEIRQITNTAAPVVNADPYPSDSGRCIVFTSTGDIDDNDGTADTNNPPTFFENSDGSQEAFLVEMDNTVFPQAGSFTQITDGPSGTTSERPVIGGFYYPRQCNTTAYASDHVQVAGGNPGLQIYRYTRNAGVNELLQAQEIPFDQRLPPAGNYFHPGMSSASNFARGPFIVFHTDADVWNNGSTNLNIFRFRVFHPRMTQYTDFSGTDVAKNAVVSDGGRWIAFESNADMIHHAKKDEPPPYNADHNFEIFRMQKLRKVRQITDTQGCINEQASINDKGNNIAFRSTCDLIPGQNPSGVPQVFYYLQVKGIDPLVGTDACKVSEGCCNVANGCYRSLEGSTYRGSKKNCLAHPKGCD
jgi:hypothetical protein